ncbi:MAG: response regulator transcription factor, partial [Myxococcota bacterium]
VEGLEVLRRIRAHGNEVPVLILTARGAEEDIVAGLEAGADDYVTKPFGVRELVARAKGILRRRPKDTVATTVTAGPFTIDFDALTVKAEDGSVRLTAREGMLLHYLLERRHRPVTREELLVDVWGYRDGHIRTRTVDVHVQQLRAKLASVGGTQWIQTIRGRGYRFVGPVA